MTGHDVRPEALLNHWCRCELIRHQRQGEDERTLSAPDPKGENQCWLMEGHVTKHQNNG